MLTLTAQDISFNQTANDKHTAITAIAASLAEKGLVTQDYLSGLLAREQQSSTFLGNGIAIPHGTTDTRDLVQQTGVAIHHFPNGVDWGNGTVYVAIGIAAKSDEHLDILKQLTKILSEDGVEQALKQAQNPQDIINLLQGHSQLSADFDTSLVQLNFPATDMLQMTAVAAGLLRDKGCVSDGYIKEVVTQSPTHLGNGLWLVSSDVATQRSAMAMVTNRQGFDYQQQAVTGLIALSAANASYQTLVNKLTDIVYQGQQNQLLNADSQTIVDLFGNQEQTLNNNQRDDLNQAVFTIKNTHGLHARPGAMLVAEAKKFSANITVSNLNGDGKSVNAKSLMKVIALGVKHGHQLQFNAQGEDAQLALTAIGQAIESGLGEGK